MTLPSAQFVCSVADSHTSLLSYTLANSPHMAWCVSVFAQVASAVSYLHAQSLLHGFLAARFVYVMSDGRTVSKMCLVGVVFSCVVERMKERAFIKV